MESECRDSLSFSPLFSGYPTTRQCEGLQPSGLVMTRNATGGTGAESTIHRNTAQNVKALCMEINKMPSTHITASAFMNGMKSHETIPIDDISKKKISDAFHAIKNGLADLQKAIEEIPDHLGHEMASDFDFIATCRIVRLRKRYYVPIWGSDEYEKLEAK